MREFNWCGWITNLLLTAILAATLLSSNQNQTSLNSVEFELEDIDARLKGINGSLGGIESNVIDINSAR